VKIRSITLLADIAPKIDTSQLRRLGAFARTARQACEDAGFEVQTLRLATNLFPTLKRFSQADDPVPLAVALEDACQGAGFEYLNLGPAGPADLPHLPEILGASRTVFASAHILDPRSGTIDGQAIHGSARAIRQIAELEEGFGNLRFAALANTPPGAPFFPAAYHRGGPAVLALATQSADLALEACTSAQHADDARHRLTTAIEQEAIRLGAVAEGLCLAHGIRFGGIDFSLAPYPTPEYSIGAALETLTGRPVGSAGTLPAAAVLTDAIDQATFPRTGFNGLLLPVLEDAVLAQRAAEGRFSVGDLLHWSAVCGTGLDTVPLPGDASEAALADLLWDVAALSARLGKPLTARLMPIPGKAAGDPVHFDFPYFAEGGVLPLEREAGQSLLQATPFLKLSSYTQSESRA
jgi:uncharacterized protein (UPF0210 family)